MVGVKIRTEVELFGAPVVKLLVRRCRGRDSAASGATRLATAGPAHRHSALTQMSRTKSYTGEYCHQGCIRVNIHTISALYIAFDGGKEHIALLMNILSHLHITVELVRRNPV